MQRIWISGYQSYELGTFGDKDPKITVIKYAIKQRLTNLLEEGQLDWVITGANLGVEQWSAEVALELRQDYNLRLAVMLPYLDFGSRWSENNQLKLQNLKNQADFWSATSKGPYQGGRQFREYQQFMFQHTDRALLVYDPEYPGKSKYDYEMIEKHLEKRDDYQLDLVDYYDLEQAARDYEENQREW